MPKYEPLTRYLEMQPGQEHSLTFAQVEAIIVGRLPPSAYKHRAWWSNNPQGHVMAQAWVNAGWETSEVDMQGRKLVFRRIRNPPHRCTGFSDRPPPSLQPGSHTLTVPGLDASTLSRLKAKAELHDCSIEDMARDILVRGAHLSPDERLALADRIRAESPGLHDVDVVAMIREDRDSR
jgi:plasmid stability protein